MFCGVNLSVPFVEWLFSVLIFLPLLTFVVFTCGKKKVEELPTGGKSVSSCRGDSTKSTIISEKGSRTSTCRQPPSQVDVEPVWSDILNDEKDAQKFLEIKREKKENSKKNGSKKETLKSTESKQTQKSSKHSQKSRNGAVELKSKASKSKLKPLSTSIVSSFELDSKKKSKGGSIAKPVESTQKSSPPLVDEQPAAKKNESDEKRKK